MTDEANKKAASAEAAKAQVKPKEAYATDSPEQAFLPNRAWLYLLPLAFLATITSVSLVFINATSSTREQELQKLEQKFEGYQSGVKDVR